MPSYLNLQTFYLKIIIYIIMKIKYVNSGENSFLSLSVHITATKRKVNRLMCEPSLVGDRD